MTQAQITKQSSTLPWILEADISGNIWIECTLANNTALKVAGALNKQDIHPGFQTLDPRHADYHTHSVLTMSIEDFRKLAIFPASLHKQQRELTNPETQDHCGNLTLAEKAPAILEDLQRNAEKQRAATALLARTLRASQTPKNVTTSPSHGIPQPPKEDWTSSLNRGHTPRNQGRW